MCKRVTRKKSTTDEDILWFKMLCDTLFILEHIQGYHCCPALSRVTSNDNKEGMVEQGVRNVRRITVRRDGVTKLTNTYVLTFNSPNLPTVVIIGLMQVK